MSADEPAALAEAVIAALEAVRVRYAEQAALAVEWAELGEFEVARRLEAETTVIAERVSAWARDVVEMRGVGDLAYEFLATLMGALDLDGALADHDPVRIAADAANLARICAELGIDPDEGAQ